MTEDDTTRTLTSCTTTTLHHLLHVGDKILKLDLEVLVVKVGQLLAKIFLVKTTLDQDVLEAGVGKCAKEFWGGNFVQKLLEDHSSTTSDNGHAARLTSGRRHLQTQRHSPGTMIDDADPESPIQELDDDAEGDREDLSRVQVDEVREEGDDKVNEIRDGSGVLSQWNSLVKNATESDGPDDDLA